jgi:hypothetical protein
MSLACPTRGLGVAALIFLAASTVVRADGDNFNNGSLNSNWGTEVTSGSGPALTLDTTDGNLAYTNTNASGEVFAYLPWTPPSSGDMSEVTLDVNVLAVPILAANSHVGVGLVVSLTGTDPGPVSAGGTGNNLTIDLAADSNNQSSSVGKFGNHRIGGGLPDGAMEQRFPDLLGFLQHERRRHVDRAFLESFPARRLELHAGRYAERRHPGNLP